MKKKVIFSVSKDHERQRDVICNILERYGIRVNRQDIADSILATGAIIPPVCVNQTLYVHVKESNPSRDRVAEVEVYAIRIDTAKNDKRFCVREKNFSWDNHYQATFKWDSIGNSIFYTYKEAEDKMNRRKKQWETT